jgi:hypothetical protein
MRGHLDGAQEKVVKQRSVGSIVFALGAVLLWAAMAEASVNLPLHHWTYEAIDRLVAMGLVNDAMVVSKPYSRKQAARYVARALERIEGASDSMEGQRALAEPLLERLVGEFRPELADLGAVPSASGASGSWFRYGGRAQLEADAFSVGHGGSGLGVRFRENRGGEYYANGEQVQSDFRGWFEIGDYLSVVAQPKYISNSYALGQGATNNAHNAYMRELSVKLSVANIAFEVGRGTQWWGPGYRGSLLLTDQAFPTDMVKLGSEESFRLPWVLRDLGEWKINSFLTQLERDRDSPRAKVFGLRVGYLPTSWLELGIARLTQFDGRAFPGQSFPKTVIKAYGSAPNALGANDVNEQVMIDFKARIPHADYLIPFPSGMQIYGEIGSEDKWSKFPLSTTAAVLGGIYIPQLFSGDSMDLRFEYADTDWGRRMTGDRHSAGWYNNATYASGMRYRGQPLGHWVGTDGIDYFLRTTRHMRDDLQLGVTWDHSLRGRNNPVSEKKQEVGMDVTWWMTKQLQLTVAYTYQHIENPGQITGINPFQETFQSGLVSNNNFIWTNLAFEF